MATEAVKSWIKLLQLISILVLALVMQAKSWSSDREPSINKVVVYKSKRILDLQHNGRTVKSYRISLGGNPVGRKLIRGDSRTPEGRYTIDYRNPQSHYHLSLHISYPSAEDLRQAGNRGVDPGGDIFIHGLPNHYAGTASQYLNYDWTDGCVAVSNKAIEEIWRRVKNGTSIVIYP